MKKVIDRTTTTTTTTTTTKTTRAKSADQYLAIIIEK